jgi:lactate dehydrogenase-like 2-hydroxyacid dehydrogenase
VDHLRVNALPANVPIAKNAGAYAESMAEHTLAMALAAAKRLPIEHQNLLRGEFNQFVRNKMLRGGTCGIFGRQASSASTDHFWPNVIGSPHNSAWFPKPHLTR